jgi:hypothetical protein
MDLIINQTRSHGNAKYNRIEVFFRQEEQELPEEIQEVNGHCRSWRKPPPPMIGFGILNHVVVISAIWEGNSSKVNSLLLKTTNSRYV